MAAVTNGTVYSGYKRNSRVYVSWSKTGESIEKNETYISWTVGIHVTNDDWWYSNSMKINATYINGVKVFSGGTYSNIQSNGHFAKSSGTATIPHNADGTKSFSVSISGWFYDYGTTSTGSGTFELPSIPRATTPTFAASTVNFGESVTINLPRATSSFTHDLSYSIGEASGTIGTGLGDSKQWTVPLSLAGEVPNSTTGIIAITCNTYNGTTLLGTKTVNLTANMPESVVPSITDIAYEDVNGHLAKYGGYVQGKSIPKLVVSATAQYSTIKQYKAAYKGTTYLSSTNEIQLGIANEAGTDSATVEAIDGRQRSAVGTKSITVIPYSAPTVRMTADRCNADGTHNDEGAYAKISCYIEISPLNNKNSKSVTLYYKKKAETNWTKGKEWSSYLIDEDVILPADTSYSYDIMLEVSDDFSQPKAVSEVGTAEVILDFNSSGTGMAIGKVSEGEGLEVAWKAKFDGDVSVTGNSVTLFGEAEEEGFIVEGSKPAKFTGDVTLNSINSNGTLVANTPIKIINSTDASGTAQRNVPLYIGADNGEHIEIDTNEIMAKATDTTTGHLYINSNGGNVHVCKDSTGGFYINNNKVADWVVDYGTSGIWAYRKWASGLAECWGTTPSVATGSLTKSGSIYYKADLNVATLPTGLFTEVEFVMGTQVSANTVGWLCQARHSNGNIYVTYDREQSSATSIVVAIKVKGRWK